MKLQLNHLIEYTWHTEVGLKAWCILIYSRNRLSHRCGYVGCSDPFAEGMGELHVHGGITWQRGVDTNYNFGCNTVGFDCLRCDDQSIEIRKDYIHNPIPCSLEYVISECEKLAAQIDTLQKSSYQV